MEAPNAAASPLAWSPDGTRIALGDDTGVVRIYDSKDGSITKTLPAGSAIISLDFHPTNSQLLVAAHAGISLWEWAGAVRLGEIPSTVSGALDFSPTGEQFVQADASELRILRSADHQLVRRLPIPEGRGRAAHWSPDGGKVGISQATSTLVFDAELAQKQVMGPGATPGVFSPAGRFFFAESNGKIFSTQRPAAYREASEQDRASLPGSLPDGVSRLDERLVFTDAQIQKQADKIGAQHAASSADGQRIWLADGQGKIHLFNQRTGAAILDFSLGEPLNDLAFNPLTGELLAAGASRLRVWGGQQGLVQASLGPGRKLELLSFLTLDAESTVGRWQLKNGGLVGGHEKHARVSVAAVPSGDYKLAFTLHRNFGIDSANIHLPVGKNRVQFVIGGDPGNGYQSGVLFRGKVLTEEPENVHGFRLAPGESHRMEIQVARDDGQARITSTLDGAPFVTWEGAQNGLGSFVEIPEPGAIAFGCFQGEVEYHDLTLEMINGTARLPDQGWRLPPAGARLVTRPGPVDLLPRVDLSLLYTADGKSSPDGVQLFHEPGTASGRAPIFVMPQGSYEFSGSFTRTVGESAISMLLPVGDHRVSLTLGKTEMEASGLALINGSGAGSPGHPATVRPHHVENRRYEFQIAVTLIEDDASIAIRLDKQPFLSWQGPQSALGVAEAWDIPDPGIFALGLQRGSVTWHALTMTMISGTAGQPSPKE